MGLIIGTAGHVDHGKTELIKALTGIDTDRLPEEKERGMTIVLGFAFIDLPKSGRVGIIDVPGHEKYLKNMLTGVWGIDLALLVIAADEGIMPQTREHFEILQFAGIKKMVVALTKIDVVAEETIESAIMEIADLLESTIYAETGSPGSKILKVSSKTGVGLPELKQTLDEILYTLPQKETVGIPILPIDRIFMLKGVGTVATGSLISGVMKVGDKVCIYPRRLSSKIKQIQVHNDIKNEIEAGNRVGINLTNIKIDDINIGDVVSREAILPTSKLIDVKLELKKGVSIKDWTRVRLHILTDEVLGRVLLLGNGTNPTLKRGVICQILLEKEVPVWFKSKFIIRNYSPSHLIGGGTVLNPIPPRHKKQDKGVIQLLKVRENYNIEEIIIEESKQKYPSTDCLAGRLACYWKTEDLKKTLFTLDNEFDKILTQIVTSGKVKLVAQYIINSTIFTKIQEDVIKELNTFYKVSIDVKIGMPKDELRKKLKIEPELFDALLQEFAELEIIKDRIRLKTWKSLLSESQTSKLKEIEELARSQFCPFGGFDREIINILSEEGKIVNIKNEFFVHIDNFEKWKKAIKEHIEKNKETSSSRQGGMAPGISIGDAKNILGTTRKYTVPFMEYLDEIKFTRRIGDKRVLY